MQAIIYIHVEAFDNSISKLIHDKITELIPSEKIILYGSEAYYKIPSHNRLTFKIENVQSSVDLLEHLNKFVKKWSFTNIYEDYSLVWDEVWDKETSPNYIHPKIKWMNIEVFNP